MANATTKVGLFIEITGLDADWTLANCGVAALNTKQKILVKSIQFNPGAANDVMIIRNGGIDATPVFRCKCTGDTDNRLRYYGTKGVLMAPVIDITDCTLGAAANSSVMIELAD